MANIKITDLNAFTDPASTDVLAIVDVSADETKKVTIADLLENAGAGTAAAPAFAFDADKDTGMYRVGANQLGFATAGTGRLFIDSSGNVGIGASPTNYAGYNNLVQNGASGSTFEQRIAGALVASLTADTQVTVKSITAIPLVLGTSNNERFRITSTGQLSHIGGGTSGSPAVAFNGSAPSNSLVIDSTGKVGVGTGSPGATVDVSASTGSLRVASSTGTNYALVASQNGTGSCRLGVESSTGSSLLIGASAYSSILCSSSSHSLHLGTNTTTALTIDQSQRVGIGTTSPGYLLDCKGTGATNVARFLTGSTSSSEVAQFGRIDQAVNLSIDYDGTGAMGIGTTTAHPLLLKTGATEKVRIDSSGNVGIKASDPLAQLHIANTSGTNGFYLSRAAGSAIGDQVSIHMLADASKARVYGYGDALTFWTAATGATASERMRITNDGFLRATTTGNYASAIGYNFAWDTISRFLIQHTSTTAGNNFGLQINYAATPNTTQNEFLYCNDSTATRFIVRSNGGLANYQSNDVNLCDEREKKNIEALDSTWSCLKHWDLKKFHYNEDADTDDKRYGVIAQQVAPHCPEVITDWVKQNAADAVLDDDGNVVTPAVEEIVRMGVKEQQMMWMAIKALQEAQTRIETLEAEVAALKGA